VLLVGCGLVATAEEVDEAAVVELRAVISEVVDTRALASEEASEWRARQAEMAALLELHRRELGLLGEELGKAGQAAGGYDESKREAEARIAELKEARAAAAETVAAQRERALAIAARFPAPLAEEVAGDRERLAAWRAGDDPREGLQAILAMVTAAEQFNRRITRRREARDGREVEVIYLGLARAFFAGPAGIAGIGVPGAEGWSWSSRPEIHGEVDKALAELDRRRPPELVRVPVEIEREEVE